MKIKKISRTSDVHAKSVIDIRGHLEVKFIHPTREENPRNLAENISAQYDLHKLTGRCKVNGFDIFLNKYESEEFYHVSYMDIDEFPGPKNYVQEEISPISEDSDKIFLVPDVDEALLDFYIEKGGKLIVRHDTHKGWVAVEFVDQVPGHQLAWIADTVAVVLDDENRLCGFRFIDVERVDQSKLDEIDNDTSRGVSLISRMMSRFLGRA